MVQSNESLVHTNNVCLTNALLLCNQTMHDTAPVPNTVGRTSMSMSMSTGFSTSSVDGSILQPYRGQPLKPGSMAPIG